MSEIVEERAFLNQPFIEEDVQDGQRLYIFDHNYQAAALLHNLSLDSNFADVSLISREGDEFPFHRSLLKALCYKQQVMSTFNNDFARVPFSSRVVQCLYDYVYKSAVQVNREIVHSLRELAVRYELEILKNDCEEIEQYLQEAQETDEEVFEFEELPRVLLEGLYDQLEQMKYSHIIARGSEKSVVLSCQDYVLAAASTFFNDHLTLGEEELRVKDDFFDVIAPMLQFIYTAEMTVDGDTVLPLMDAAIFLVIPSIVYATCSWLKDAVVANNALGILKASQVMMMKPDFKDDTSKTMMESLEDLYNFTRNEILSRFMEIQDEEEFLELTKEELVDLIDDDKLVVQSEEDVFYAVAKWVGDDHQERAEHLYILLQKVRLEHTSIEFLKEALRHPLVEKNRDCIALINPLVYDQYEYDEQPLPSLEDIHQESFFDLPPFPTQAAENIGEFPNCEYSVINSTPEKNPIDMRLRKNRQTHLEQGKNIDGTPDMRLKENKQAVGNVARKLEFKTADASSTPRRKDGKPDMRFKINRKSLERKAGEEEVKLLREGPLTKSGKPDMRFKANYASGKAVLQAGPKNVDGSPDMRYKANKQPVRVSYSGESKGNGANQKQNTSKVRVELLREGPKRKDGKPDMRFKANFAPGKGVLSHGPKMLDGRPDMGFKENKELVKVSYADNKKQGTQKIARKFTRDSGGPLKKDGSPDMRYAANRMKTTSYKCTGESSFHTSGPLKKDGKPDMRFKANKDSIVGVSTTNSTSGGPIKKDGTPDMRFRANKSASMSGIGGSSNSIGSGYDRAPITGSDRSLSSFLSSLTTGPTKSDGTPDMRYRANKDAFGSSSSLSSSGSCSSYRTTRSTSSGNSSSGGPLKKDGTPDMRYSANKSTYGLGSSSSSSQGGSSYSGGYSGGQSSYTRSGPLKRDGTPDMRYKANRR